MYRQEAHGLKLYVQLLLKLFVFESKGVLTYTAHADGSGVQTRLMLLMGHILPDYASKTEKNQADALRCLDIVVCTLLEGIQSLDSKHMLKILPIFYTQIVSLIQLGSQTVRNVLFKLMSSATVKEAFARGCGGGPLN
jgi:hypothetical protein